MPIDEMILESLNWFANFQISVLNKRKKRDAIDRTFIEKLKREMLQSEHVVRNNFAGITEFEQDIFERLEL